MSYTKGPWPVIYENADERSGGQWYDVGPAKIWFSYSSSNEEENIAYSNACLISAAPEMLEALKAMVQWGKMKEPDTYFHMADKAIAKATGEK